MTSIVPKLMNDSIHVWLVNLSISREEQSYARKCLNVGEKARADRFKQAKHREYFTAARAFLRQIVSLYLNISPCSVCFYYSENGKPLLEKTHNSPIVFNVSHSENQAIIATGLNHPIGVDIEQSKPEYTEAIAKRFFSPEENNALLSLPKHSRSSAFYRLWSRKEALLKATGTGLTSDIHHTNLSVNPVSEIYQHQQQSWRILPLACQDGFEASLACTPLIEKIIYFTPDSLSETPTVSKEVVI